MSKFEKDKDIFFMQAALRQARKAFANDEVPVGAVVVDPQGKIISRGHNMVEKKNTQAAHAEILALEKAGKKRENWRMEGCWLYVTLEPCVMCMGLIFLSRLEGIVFGASSLLFGYRLDKHVPLSVYNNDMLSVVSGVCVNDSVRLLKKFFKNKRENE